MAIGGETGGMALARTLFSSAPIRRVNRQRPILHMALEQDYDIIGMRWDADHGDNLILLQRLLMN